MCRAQSSWIVLAAAAESSAMFALHTATVFHEQHQLYKLAASSIANTDRCWAVICAVLFAGW
jgi:hypothetical protein